MRDPFAFMGIMRGSGRPDEPTPARIAKLRFAVPDDEELTVACAQLLDELNGRAKPPKPDVVANIASHYGLYCETLWTGIFTLRYRGPETVAFLVQRDPSALSRAPAFQLFISAGVQLA